MRKNYILIDYENVQPEAIAALTQEHFHVVVFVGANQSKVNIDLVMALQHMGARASYLRIAGSGKNALDFHIAFYIGRFLAVEPDAYFHIISADSGFDPLIAHLKELGVFASRSKSIIDIPCIKATVACSSSDRVEAVVAHLHRMGTAKPRAVKTLQSTMNALFQKALAQDELDELLRLLKQKGVVTVNDTKITYTFPASSKKAA